MLFYNALENIFEDLDNVCSSIVENKKSGPK